MPDPARVRIVTASGELEISGDASVLAKYDPDIRKLLDQLTSGVPIQGASRAGAAAGTGNGVARPAGGTAGGPLGMDMDFGELVHRLPKAATAVDKILLAGRYVQQSSAGQVFSTRDANQLLIDQGIKIANPSQSLTNALKAKRVFKTNGAYRVSQSGDQHLVEMLGSDS